MLSLPDVDFSLLSYFNISHMQVTILGASGQIGRACLAESLRQGYQVKVLVRSPAKLGSFKNEVSIVEGNLLNASLLGEALIGSVAVLNLAGV